MVVSSALCTRAFSRRVSLSVFALTRVMSRYRQMAIAPQTSGISAIHGKYWTIGYAAVINLVFVGVESRAPPTDGSDHEAMSHATTGVTMVNISGCCATVTTRPRGSTSIVPMIAAAAKDRRYGNPMLPVGSAVMIPMIPASTNSSGGAQMGSRRGPERRAAFGWAGVEVSDTIPDLTVWPPP